MLRLQMLLVQPLKDEEGRPLIEGDPKTLTIEEICEQVEFDHMIAKGDLRRGSSLEHAALARPSAQA